MNNLSVIMISRNQEASIARLIESVLAETNAREEAQIILVDSASTDATTEIASQYPITVIRLHPDQQLSPAAGRFVGCKYATGRLILFLDGDMELCPGWLAAAERILDTRPDVAVLTGQVVDVPKATQPHERPQLPILTEVPINTLRYCGGAALYRRSVLDAVGNFNPYLRSDEEPELCIRVRHAGYHIVRIEQPIVWHYSDPGEEMTTIIGRWRRHLYLGAGQNLRYLIGTATFWRYVSERGFGLAPLVGLGVGMLSLGAGLRMGRWRWFGAWLTLFVLFLTSDAVRKRSAYLTMASLIKRLFIVDGTIRGFLAQPKPPETYPAAVDIIRWGD